MKFKVLYEKDMKEIHRLKSASVPVKIAVLSFICGTVLFVMSLCNLISVYLIYASFFILLIAIIINLISLIYLIRKWIIIPKTQVKTAEEIAVVLANIPITILYFFILFL